MKKNDSIKIKKYEVKNNANNIEKSIINWTRENSLHNVLLMISENRTYL